MNENGKPSERVGRKTPESERIVSYRREVTMKTIMKYSVLGMIGLLMAAMVVLWTGRMLWALQTSAQIRITCTVLPKPANLKIASSELSNLSGKSMDEIRLFAQSKGVSLHEFPSDGGAILKFTKTA